MARAVLDASALLAYMRDEPGAQTVAAALERGCAISVINLAEVLGKLAEAGADPGRAAAALDSLGEALEIFEANAPDATEIARLRPLTRAAGLSLGDRACLALALRLRLPALTADQTWNQLDLDVEVVSIRGRGAA